MANTSSVLFPRTRRALRGATVLTFCLTGCLIASSAEAQITSFIPRRSPRTSNVTPNFSPYLGLLRTDGGPLPNYFQFVRPQTQLQDALERQDRALQRERQRLQTVTRRIDSIEQGGGSRPTGVHGGFMRYSHFYPQLR